MPCYLRKMHLLFFFVAFCLCYMGVQICGNLNAKNKMRDTGKGTYLVVRNSENGKMHRIAASYLWNRVWAYGTAPITHGRFETWKLFRNLKTMWCEVYNTIAITSRQDVSIWHGRYHPLQMRTRDFSGNLITVMMWGIWHGRYFLKKGCEHMARPLSPIANANSGFF